MATPSGARTPLTPSGDNTTGFSFHSLCLQIKDPARSLSFYRDVLGMRIAKVSESEGFSMIFLGFPGREGGKGEQAASDGEIQFATARGLIQLVHVHGTDEDPSFCINPGSSPGFCHLSLCVPDLEGALARMSRFGVRILERGEGEGSRGGYAAIADPDGYSIQLLSQDRTREEDLRSKLEELMRAGRASGLEGVVSPPRIAGGNDVPAR